MKRRRISGCLEDMEMQEGEINSGGFFLLVEMWNYERDKRKERGRRIRLYRQLNGSDWITE